jgi:hypothetical protein
MDVPGGEMLIVNGHEAKIKTVDLSINPYICITYLIRVDRHDEKRTACGYGATDDARMNDAMGKIVALGHKIGGELIIPSPKPQADQLRVYDNSNGRTSTTWSYKRIPAICSVPGCNEEIDISVCRKGLKNFCPTHQREHKLEQARREYAAKKKKNFYGNNNPLNDCSSGI